MNTPDRRDDRGDHTFPGVAVGIVADNEDPDNMGRVKLTFPWRDVDDETRWAPVAAPMAGDDAGTYFLPEENDRVLVAFERGDIHYPYVVGSIWNDDQAPPAENDGDNDIRRIQSRSGHHLTFDDDESAGAVRIETAAGHSITLDDSSGEETITVEDTSGANRIEFDATAGSLSIESGGSLSIEAPTIDISADGNVTIEANGVLTLDGALIQLN